jgi:alcohol dehydrogenase class IV
MLNDLEDLEEALLKLYTDMAITPTLKSNNIPEDDLKKIAFYTYRDAVNIATNPARLSERKILTLLEEVYD